MRNQQYNIFCSCDDNLEQMEFYQSLKKDLAIANINLVAEMKDDHGNRFDKTKIEGDYTNVINSLNKEEYYLEVIKLVSKIIDRDEISQLAKDFSQYYSSIVESTENIDISKLQKEVITQKNRVGFYVIILVTLVVTSVISYLFIDPSSLNSIAALIVSETLF